MILTYYNIGNVIEGPSNVTYLPGVTSLPIELTCDVTGSTVWRVNGLSYTLGQLTHGELPGHSSRGSNILVNSPVNNTEYICVSNTNDGETSSDPAYVIIAGEYVPCTCMLCVLSYFNISISIHQCIIIMHLCMHTALYVINNSMFNHIKIQIRHLSVYNEVIRKSYG